MTPRLLVALFLAIGCTGVATSLSGRPGPEAGLLRGKSPARSLGVTHVDRLTDGIAALPDDPPRTELTSVLAPEAYAIYDLERETRIACAALIADGDDRYTIALSSDGNDFRPLWSAGETGERGMQPRVRRGLEGSGRWLRLTASGGDGAYAVAELAVAETCPPRWPPALALQRGTPLENAVQTKAWAFAGLAAAFILAYRRRAPDFIKLLGAVPVGVAIALVIQLVELWPFPPSVVAALVGALATVGGAVVLRFIVTRLWRRRRAAKTK